MNNRQAKIGTYIGSVSAGGNLLQTIKTQLGVNSITIYGFTIVTTGDCTITLNPNSKVMVMNLGGTYTVNVPTVFTGIGAVISELTFDASTTIRSMNYFYT